MSDINNEKFLADAVKIGTSLGESKIVTDGLLEYAVIPQGYQIESLEKFRFNDYNPEPHRKKANVTLKDPASFITYWRLFSDGDSRIFGYREGDSFIASLDYHRSGDGGPRWRQHWSTLQLQHTEEWQTWFASNGKKMSQAEMALFIEDNAPDIVSPDAATMFEVASTLQSKTDCDFEGSVRLNTGQVQLSYKEEIKGSWGTGKMEIPQVFFIKLAVYDGMDPIEMKARLRYRMPGGKLSMWYDLHRPGALKRDAFGIVADQLANECGSEILMGKP